jgi:hypothetical protein
LKWLRSKIAPNSDKLGPWTWKIDHEHGIVTIYAATIAFWLYLSIDSTLHLVVPTTDSALPTTIPALVATILVMGRGWRLVQCQRKKRDDELRKHVLTALDLLAAFDNDLSRLEKDTDRHAEFLNSCTQALGKQGVVSAPAQFYGRLTPEALGYYAMTESKLHKTASLVSLLTDLPPLWILDLAVNRLGTRPLDWMSSLAPDQRDETLASTSN